MVKKLLLVDDERTFLESLKVGLSKYSHLFETDICFSVDEAIELTGKEEYNLIIAGMIMPQKNGVELATHLHTERFKGKLMLIVPLTNKKIYRKIKKAGILEVIQVPLNDEWFQEMLFDFFAEEEEIPGNIASIDLEALRNIVLDIENGNIESSEEDPDTPGNGGSPVEKIIAAAAASEDIADVVIVNKDGDLLGHTPFDNPKETGSQVLFLGTNGRQIGDTFSISPLVFGCV